MRARGTPSRSQRSLGLFDYDDSVKTRLVAVLVVVSSCGFGGRLPPESRCEEPLAEPRFVASLVAPVGEPGVFPVFGPPSCTQALATEAHADGPSGARIDGLEAAVANEQSIETGTAMLRQAQVNFTPPETGIWTISVRWSWVITSARSPFILLFARTPQG